MDKVLMFSVCVVLMMCLQWVTPVGTYAIIALFGLNQCFTGFNNANKKEDKELTPHRGSYYRVNRF